MISSCCLKHCVCAPFVVHQIWRKTKLFREKVSVFLYRRSQITEHDQKRYSADSIAFFKTIYVSTSTKRILQIHRNVALVGNPIGKKTLIFTFDGKIEYIILPMLILFLDMWQNTYGWIPSL